MNSTSNGGKLGKRVVLPLFVLPLFVLFASAVQARTLTWQGANGGKWSVAANWLDGSATATTAPADGDIVKFTNSSALSVTNDLTNLLVGGIALFNTKNLTIAGNAFRYSGEVTMNQVSANVIDTIKPAIELTTDLIVRFKIGSGNKSHQIKFDGVLSGAGGLAVDTSGGSGDSAIYLNALNTFTGEVNYTGNNGYVFTYFKTIANAGEPSSFGAGTGKVVIDGRLGAQATTGSGGTTDRAWAVRKCYAWILGNKNPLVFNNTFDFNGCNVSYTSGGTLVFNGQVLRLAQITSTNGNKLQFNSADNTASSAQSVILKQTTLHAKKLADGGQQSSIGTGSLIQLGQEYDTSATVYYTGSENASCNRTIDVVCASAKTTVHTISVTNALATLDLSGTIKSSTSTTPTFTLSGAGGTRTSGTMQNTYSVNKTGSGTWTHSGTATYTGATTVSAGKLYLSGTMSSAITVKSGARLGGCGTASGNVTLAAGAKLSLTNVADTLTVGGKLTVSGNITVEMPADWDGTTCKILTYSSYAASGNVTVTGSSYDARAEFGADGINIIREYPPSEATWDGGAGVDETSVGTASNWVGDTLPDFTGGNLTATFANGGTTATVDRAVMLARLLFNTPGDGFALADGGGSLRLRTGGLSAAAGATAKKYEIDVPVLLDGAQTWAISNATKAASVVLTKPVSSLTAGALTKTGGGTLSFKGANTFTGNLAINAGNVRVYEGATLGAGGVGKVTIKWPDAKLYLHNATVDRVLETSGAAGATAEGSIEAVANTTNVLKRLVTRTDGNLRLYSREGARLVIEGGLQGNWFHPDGGGEFVITNTPLNCNYFGAYSGSATVRFQVAGNSCGSLGLGQGCSATYHFDVDNVFAKRNSAYPDLNSSTGGSAFIYLHGTRQNFKDLRADFGSSYLSSTEPGAVINFTQGTTYTNRWRTSGHLSFYKGGSATAAFKESGTAVGTIGVSAGTFALANGARWTGVTNVVVTSSGAFLTSAANALSKDCDFTLDGANAKLKLNFSGTAVCNRLFMRNAQNRLCPVKAGVYGASDNASAPIRLANITGTGLLKVRKPSGIAFILR